MHNRLNPYLHIFISYWARKDQLKRKQGPELEEAKDSKEKGAWLESSKRVDGGK